MLFCFFGCHHLHGCWVPEFLQVLVHITLKTLEFSCNFASLIPIRHKFNLSQPKNMTQYRLPFKARVLINQIDILIGLIRLSTF